MITRQEQEDRMKQDKIDSEEAVKLFIAINDHIKLHSPSPEAIKRALHAQAILCLGEGDLTV